MTEFSRRNWLAMAGMAGVAMAGRSAMGTVARIHGGGGTPPNPFARNVLDFGARGDGKTDNTTAFQKALDAAHSAGGGIVRVPAGRYLFKGHLTMPANTTLEGVFGAPPAYVYPDPGNGTVLLPTQGRGREDGPSFIGVGGPNCTICGLGIYYPEQDPKAAEPAPYPWAIGIIPSLTGTRSFSAEGAPYPWPTGSVPQQQDLSVIDVALTNPYQGINLAGAVRHYIARVYGRPLKTGIYVDQCFDVGRIENVHFLPFWGGINNTPMDAWTQNHGTAFCFGRSDAQYVFNTFCFQYHTGYHFIQTPSGSCYGNFLGLGADTCHCPVKVDASEFIVGLQITNGEFSGYVGSDPQGFAVGPDNTGQVCMTNCAFWGGNLKHFGTVRGTGAVSLIGCNFKGTWDMSNRGEPAILCDGAPTIISNCRFDPVVPANSRRIIAGITKRCAGAVITGNITNGTAFTVDRAGELPPGKFQIHSNIAVG